VHEDLLSILEGLADRVYLNYLPLIFSGIFSFEWEYQGLQKECGKTPDIPVPKGMLSHKNPTTQ
jgi:hypothetical protein